MKIEHISRSRWADKPLTWDIHYPQAQDKPYPVMLFLHGFMGFKDWGHWDLLAQYFTEKGYCFVKLNFSHNGTTPEQPTEFADLEAFGHNNFSKELTDVATLLDELPDHVADLHDLTIMGHSRGGGIALLAGERDARIRRVVLLASVAALDYAWADKPDYLVEWQRAGVVYRRNNRTGQELPLYYQLYEDYQAHAQAYTLSLALERMDKPLLIIHGDKDTAVPVGAADVLAAHARRAKRIILEEANHVFGGSHPYGQSDLPAHSVMAAEAIGHWIRQQR